VKSYSVLVEDMYTIWNWG